MKSREPAVRPDIAANDLGPIEQHLQALATARRLPRTALLMCIARYEEAAPTLRAVLERAADGALLSEDERMLLFHGVHIQGTVRDELACPALLRLLRRPEPELDRLLGLALTESLSRILCGVFDGDVDALLALIADRKVDEFVRHAVFGAAAFLTWDGRIPAERMHGFLQRFDADRLAGKGDHTWIGWLETIALLGLRDLAPLVHRAWDDGRVNTEYLARQDFETELREAETAPRDVARFRRSRLGYVEDVLGMLEWTERAELEDDTLAAWSALPPAPVTNPWRNVGRNDPCPCGSGKKAKHCHLAQ